MDTAKSNLASAQQSAAEQSPLSRQTSTWESDASVKAYDARVVEPSLTLLGPLQSTVSHSTTRLWPLSRRRSTIEQKADGFPWHRLRGYHHLEAAHENEPRLAVPSCQV